jgi:hypothetical protein
MATGKRGLQPERAEDGPGQYEAEPPQRLAARQ